MGGDNLITGGDGDLITNTFVCGVRHGRFDDRRCQDKIKLISIEAYKNKLFPNLRLNQLENRNAHLI